MDPITFQQFLDAAKSGNLSTILLYISENRHKEKAINQRDKLGNTAFFYAAAFGDIDVVKALLRQRNIEINAVNDRGDTPLLLAIWNRHTAVALAV